MEDLISFKRAQLVLSYHLISVPSMFLCNFTCHHSSENENKDNLPIKQRQKYSDTQTKINTVREFCPSYTANVKMDKISWTYSVGLNLMFWKNINFLHSIECLHCKFTIQRTAVCSSYQSQNHPECVWPFQPGELEFDLSGTFGLSLMAGFGAVAGELLSSDLNQTNLYSYILRVQYVLTHSMYIVSYYIKWVKTSWTYCNTRIAS